MIPDEYVQKVVDRYGINIQTGSPVILAAQSIYPILSEWAGTQLEEIKFSGSHAKGTAIAGRSDTDLFISLKPDTTNTLKEIYYSLNQRMRSKGYQTKLQNVSIKVTHQGIEVDLVPGVRLPGNSNDHWLYIRKPERERTKTNIYKHIDVVRSSGRTEEIKAIKIWATNHKLDFSSIYLELTVINALSGYRMGLSANNVLRVLEYLGDNFIDEQVVDPSNSANIISNDLTIQEKQIIATQANTSRLSTMWDNIFW
jgi:hypothetical protein